MLPADVQDRDGARALLERVRGRPPRPQVIWADGAYTAAADGVRQTFGWVLTTILRPVGVKGYEHLPERRIVERTFGRLGRYRRLSKDYEANPRSREAWIYITMTHRMSRYMLPGPNADQRPYRRRPSKC